MASCAASMKATNKHNNIPITKNSCVCEETRRYPADNQSRYAETIPHVSNTRIKPPCCVIRRKAWKGGRCCESAGRGIPCFESNSSILFTNDIGHFPQRQNQTTFIAKHLPGPGAGQPLSAFVSFLRRNIRRLERHRLPPRSDNLRRRRKPDRNPHATSSFRCTVAIHRILENLLIPKPSHQ